MVHNFNVDIAVKYGVDEAILIELIYWWIHKNECEEVEEMNIDGRFWCRSTAKGIAKFIPYMKPSKIWRLLRGLEVEQVLIIGNFNNKPTNQTLWYTFTDSFRNEMEELGYDFSKMKNGIFKNEKSIDNNIQDNINNKEEKILSDDNKKEEYTEDFEKFWKLYNFSRGGKKAAFTTWKNLTKKDKVAAMEALPAYLEDCARNMRSKQYPTTYLHKRTFEDDFTNQGRVEPYEPLETDSDEKRRFKKWMRNEYPEIENTYKPLSYEDYMSFIKEYGVSFVSSCMEELYVDIHKYRRSDIALVLRQKLSE